LIKKSFTYKDLDGNDVTEEFYFALNAAELAELEMSERGGLIEWLKQIMADEDGKQIMAKFKEIILASVGRRSADAKRFIKNDEIRQDFLNSEPYSMLFMEMITNAPEASKFIMGLVPAGLQEQIKDVELPTNKDIADGLGIKESTVRPMEDTRPAWVRENRAPRQNELVGLSQAELIQAFEWREHLMGQSQ